MDEIGGFETKFWDKAPPGLSVVDAAAEVP